MSNIDLLPGPGSYVAGTVKEHTDARLVLEDARGRASVLDLTEAEIAAELRAGLAGIEDALGEVVSVKRVDPRQAPRWDDVAERVVFPAEAYSVIRQVEPDHSLRAFASPAVQRMAALDLGIKVPWNEESGSGGMYSSRGGSVVDTYQVHHAAMSSYSGLKSMISTGSREVSANFLGASDGTVALCVPVGSRAWTSGSASWDSRSVTIEMCNSAVGGSWPISEASQLAHARIAAWMDAVYPAFALNRDRILGHSELYTRYGASYATACPGGTNLDRIVRDAVTLRDGFEVVAKLLTNGSVDMLPIRNAKTGAIMMTTAFTSYHEEGPNRASIANEYAAAAGAPIPRASNGKLEYINWDPMWHILLNEVQERNAAALRGVLGLTKVT